MADKPFWIVTIEFRTETGDKSHTARLRDGLGIEEDVVDVISEGLRDLWKTQEEMPTGRQNSKIDSIYADRIMSGGVKSIRVDIGGQELDKIRYQGFDKILREEARNEYTTD